MIKTADQLVQACLDLARNYKTIYVLGCIGAPMTKESKARYKREYSFNARDYRAGVIDNASEDTFGFDCVCFIKSLLWGWSGDVNAQYGGAKYRSNGVEDYNDQEIRSRCNVSTDFSTIVPGEAVFTDTHIGIYVGNNTVVECTYNWNDGVQETSLYNVKLEKGKNGRYWVDHGKLPWIEYPESKPEPAGNYDYVLQMNYVRRGSKGNAVKAVQTLLIAYGYDCGYYGADGVCGYGTEKAVIKYQVDHGLASDGIVGKNTMSKLLGL